MDRTDRLIEAVAEYMQEDAMSDSILLTKGYKPKLETLVQLLGWAEDYHGNQLLIKIPQY